MSIDKLLRRAIEKHELLQYEEAATLYRKILTTKPRHLDAHYLLGTLYAECGDFDKAQKHLLRATQINPNTPMAHTNLGNVYRKLGKHDLALKCYNYAIKLMPNLFPAVFGLASTLMNLGEDYDNAIECFKKALEIAPENYIPEIYYQMGILSIKSGNLESALKLFENARNMNPDLPDIKSDFGIQLDMGFICLREGKNKEAEGYFREALNIFPNSFKASYFLEIAQGHTPGNDLILKYTANEFNSYATTFDKDLVEKLHYTLPFKIPETLTQICGTDYHFDSVMDLGCGTGLTGEALRKATNHLSGIDISERMIDISRNKNCYDQLFCGDLVQELNKLDDLFDLFVATDVLIYIGKIDELLSAIISHARPEALFLFSTESSDEEGMRLQNSGRFAHNSGYVHDIVKKFDCSIILEEVIDLRKEAGAWIKGELFVVKLSNR